MTHSTNDLLPISFELTENQFIIRSLWGAELRPINLPENNFNERQLIDFFFLLNGGANFLDTLLFISKNDCKISDFAELAESPIKYPEFYPKNPSDNWDFNAYSTALIQNLGENADQFFEQLNEYFDTYYGGLTLADRITTKFIDMPIGTYLTDGVEVVVIAQQNINTTYLFDGFDFFAAADGLEKLREIAPENIPTKALKTLNDELLKATEKSEEYRTEIMEKLDKKAEREAAKELAAAEKQQKANNSNWAKIFELIEANYPLIADTIKPEYDMTQLLAILCAANDNGENIPTYGMEFSTIYKAAKADCAKAAKKGKEQSATQKSAQLLKEFFALEHKDGTTIEDLKEWLKTNQRELIAETDRKAAIGLYNTLKTKAANEAKEAAAKAKAAEKEAAAKAKETAKAAETADAKNELIEGNF